MPLNNKVSAGTQWPKRALEGKILFGEPLPNHYVAHLLNYVALCGTIRQTY